MATQADVDALTAEVNQISTDLNSVQTDLDDSTTKLQAEIDSLAAGNPGLDLSALQAAVEPIDEAVANLGDHAKALGDLAPSQPAAPDPAVPETGEPTA